MTRKMLLVGISACLVVLAALGSGVSADGLVNEEVKRTVDLSTHLAKITAEILLANSGDSAAHSFTLAVEPDLAPHLAYIGASVSLPAMRKTHNTHISTHTTVAVCRNALALAC